MSARVLDRLGDRTLLEIVMGEGRKREVRRMCQAVGAEVVTLFRTAIGPLSDGDLREGQWRHVGIEEVRALYGAPMS